MQTFFEMLSRETEDLRRCAQAGSLHCSVIGKCMGHGGSGNSIPN